MDTNDISSIFLLLIVLGFLILLSAFFAVSETALFSLSKAKIERLRRSDSKLDRFVAKLLDDPSRLLITILIGNTFVNTASASLVASFVTSIMGNRGIGIAIGVTTVTLVIFGDIMPKTIAIHHAEPVSKFVAYPIDLFSKLISPVRRIFSSMTNSLIEFMSGDDSEDKVTTEELKTMVEMAEEDGSIEQQEKEIINAIFDLRHITAAEIMAPRTEMLCASDDMTLEQVFKLGRKSQRSKIPVYKDDIDHIFGIVYIRDFLMWQRYNVNSLTIAEFMNKRENLWIGGQGTLIREPFFAPETRYGIGLLQDFRENKTRMAILLDEYGGTAGLVTMRDLLKELVGEISEEHGDSIDEFREIDDQTTVVLGKASIRDVNKKLELDLPADGDIDTIGGYVISLFGRIPDVGETISSDIAEFEIAGEDGRRITEILIRKKLDSIEEENDE
ncbi:MAG: HlyC/CorC family transporter [Candidatus Poribacteria bacterium]|nr:HlyC/CorC family transporter [Candidatus Poribacteria bacterium]MDQ1326820.1 HlyC/CorC family transporter [Candidatus Poribacteria bacterium]